MNIIDNNPYRLLGVYANSTAKERLANDSKLKAFLKVGKAITFPLDLSQYLPPLSRTSESVANAAAQLTLPADQLKYAQFWFINVTPIDNVAFNHLIAGNIAKANDFWSKQSNASSLQNRMVCALFQKDYTTACSLASTLYASYATQLVEEVLGKAATVPHSLAFNFIDTLCDEVGYATIMPAISDPVWKRHLAAKAVQPIIEQLQAAIEAAKQSRGKGSQARLMAGMKLMNSAKPNLAKLQKILPPTDLRYQMIADKLAQEILQCGIDYYNDSKDDDSANKAMVLQEYALKIAVGAMAKDRCQQTYNILKKIIDNLPPQEVRSEFKAVQTAINDFCDSPDSIDNANKLLNAAKPYLDKIKAKLGSSNARYLKLSTSVVDNALHDIIAEVNNKLNTYNSFAKYAEFSLDNKKLTLLRDDLESTLRKAWDATKLMDGFNMEYEFRQKRYNPNRKTLKGLCEQCGISTYTPTPRPIKPTPTPPKAPSRTPEQPASRPSKQPANRGQAPSQPDDSTPWGCIIAMGIAVILTIIFVIIQSNNSTKDATTLYYDSVAAVDPEATYRTTYPHEEYDSSDSSYSTDDDIYTDNSLANGAQPYKAYYGKGKTGYNYMDFNASQVSDCDYVILAKRHSTGTVVNHIYLQGGHSARMYVPDGTYDIYFYSGKGWNPNKEMSGGIQGGFVHSESYQEDPNISLYDQYCEYTLYPVKNGNLQLAQSSENEMFN